MSQHLPLPFSSEICVGLWFPYCVQSNVVLHYVFSRPANAKVVLQCLFLLVSSDSCVDGFVGACSSGRCVTLFVIVCFKQASSYSLFLQV